MEDQAAIFKNDILRGISLAVKNLQQQDAKVKSSNPKGQHPVTKQNLHFRNLLNYLDLAFSFAIKDSRRGYWPLIKKVAHSSVLDMINKHSASNNEIKKSYLWLYLTFIENSLLSYLKMMLAETKFLKTHYKDFAVLRDMERCEILMNLLAGTEPLFFSITFEDPYLDYGHEPLLKQEKVVAHTEAATSHKATHQKPDITLVDENSKPRNAYPDLVTEHPSVKKGCPPVQEIADGNDLVYQKPGKKKSKKKKHLETDQVDGSTIPPPIATPQTQETVNTTEVKPKQSLDNAIDVPDEPESVLATSDPMQKNVSKGDHDYEDLLKSFGKSGEKSHPESTTIVNNELPLSVELHERDVQNMTLEDHDKKNEDSLENLDDFSFYRTDSFDKFCRRNSADESDGKKEIDVGLAVDALAVEEAELAEHHTLSASPVAVAPQISQESLRRTYSPMSKSISKSSIDKLNDARYDTKTGILLPTLPRRPALCDATDMSEEVNITQNELVLLSVEIFQQPTEAIIKVFKVFIGHLAGYGAPFYLLVSNVSVYLLKKSESTGFSNVLCVSLDNVNKVQTGLNFQDVFIFHDEGCLHVSTRDEVVSRAIISTIKGAIKSSQGLNPDGSEPMASNTYNELDLVIQDWLICHTRVEEPEILHFSLIYYSSLASEKQRKNGKVRKAAQMSFRQSNFGLMHYWEKAFFALKGHILYQYNAKPNLFFHTTGSCYNLSTLRMAEFKTTPRGGFKSGADLTEESVLKSTQCCGCISCGREDGVFVLKIIGVDGSSSILELGIGDETESNDWLMSICQVVADAKINDTKANVEEPETAVACGLVLTPDKVFLFNQDPKSGRLVLEDSCLIQNITQVCVDNHCRTFCTLNHSSLSDWTTGNKPQSQRTTGQKTFPQCFLNSFLMSVYAPINDTNTSAEEHEIAVARGLALTPDKSIDHDLEQVEKSKKTMWLFDFQSEYELGKFEQKLHGCWHLLYQVPLQFVLLADQTLKKVIQIVLNEKGQNHGKIEKEVLYELVSN